MAKNRADDWWRQARNDLAFARMALRGRRYPDGLPAGAPFETFNAAHAKAAIAAATSLFAAAERLRARRTKR